MTTRTVLLAHRQHLRYTRAGIFGPILRASRIPRADDDIPTQPKVKLAFMAAEIRVLVGIGRAVDALLPAASRTWADP